MIHNGIRDPWLNNIISLVKGHLARNRDEEIEPRTISASIRSRIEDLEAINLNKTKAKTLRAQKMVIVSTNR